MDQVLGYLPFCFVYVDDILSWDLSSHVDNLREIFCLCRKHGLTNGCEFAVSKIEFLGHLLSANGCFPLDKHSVAISAFRPPSDKPALQRFLGMLNFYRKFLWGAARVLASLTDALKGPGKSLTWSPVLDSLSPEPRLFSPLFLSWSILTLMLLSLSPLMPPIPTWVLFSSNSWTFLGSPFYSKKLFNCREEILCFWQNSWLSTLSL